MEIEKENLVTNYTEKPGLSNSRLSVHSERQIQKSIGLSFDRITVAGGLIPSREHSLKKQIESDPRIDVTNTGYDKFRCTAFKNKVFVEYNRKKAQAMNHSEIRVEFNPNELTEEEKGLVQFIFLDNMRDKHFTRIDVAFDLEMDLSKYYAMTDKALKRTIFFGRDNKVETKYFGVRDSERYIRIYDKKRQMSEVKKKEISADHFWRVEFELKQSMTNKWDKCLDDIHILIPAWETIENMQTRAMVYLLLHEDHQWAELERKTKYKYKKMIKEISAVNIADDLRKVLSDKHQKLSEELQNYIAISHHDKLYDFDFGH